jgi:hypothetical protein
MKKNKPKEKSEKTFYETLIDLIDNAKEEVIEVSILKEADELEILAIVKFIESDWITLIQEDYQGNVSKIDIDWEINKFREIISKK